MSPPARDAQPPARKPCGHRARRSGRRPHWAASRMLAPLKRTGGTAAPKTAKTSRRGSPLAAMPSPPLSRPCVPAESLSQSSPQFCWNRLLQGCCCCCWVKFQKVGTGCLRQILHKAAHTRTAHAHAEPSRWLSHATSCALEFEQGERRWAVFKKRTAPRTRNSLKKQRC